MCALAKVTRAEPVPGPALPQQCALRLAAAQPHAAAPQAAAKWAHHATIEQRAPQCRWERRSVHHARPCHVPLAEVEQAHPDDTGPLVHEAQPAARRCHCAAPR